ncbi:MAG: hypothetical protein QOD77_485 [Thermoplasmata archaeon]|jgi:hypothetical protein|nr:hypothetical protein [Thermoplasmata archaeon]
MRTLALPATAVCLLAALVAAPAASAWFFAWGDEDRCDSTLAGMPRTWCTVNGGLVGQVDNAGAACVKSGAIYLSCQFVVTCGSSFSNEVPVHFESRCTGSPPESCDQLQPGAWGGCGAADPTFTVDVGAGSCVLYTMQATVTPLVPTLPSASIGRTVTMCVDGAAGPSVA